MSNEIQTIVKWFSDAKPNPTIGDIAVQVGCHYEEVAEMGLSLNDGLLVRSCVDTSELYKRKVKYIVEAMAYNIYRDDEAKQELLDSLCDQVVTAIGVAQLAGMDIVGALNEVIASNDSKRMPDGSFPLDENGKITKDSPNFFKPDLSKFITK